MSKPSKMSIAVHAAMKEQVEKMCKALEQFDEDLLYATFGRKKGSAISVQVGRSFNQLQELQQEIGDNLTDI